MTFHEIFHALISILVNILAYIFVAWIMISAVAGVVHKTRTPTSRIRIALNISGVVLGHLLVMYVGLWMIQVTPGFPPFLLGIKMASYRRIFMISPFWFGGCLQCGLNHLRNTYEAASPDQLEECKRILWKQPNVAGLKRVIFLAFVINRDIETLVRSGLFLAELDEHLAEKERKCYQMMNRIDAIVQAGLSNHAEAVELRESVASIFDDLASIRKDCGVEKVANPQGSGDRP